MTSFLLQTENKTNWLVSLQPQCNPPFLLTPGCPIHVGVGGGWRNEIAQVAIGSDHASAYQRDRTSKKGHVEKVIFVMASS